MYKSPTGGNVDGHACMHRYISIGRDNRYEHEVTPLGGTRMRIPVAARKLPCSGVLRGLIQLCVRNGHARMSDYSGIGRDNRVEPQGDSPDCEYL